MSRHEGVSCDSCLRSNFRGLRHKCLICYDYDLCSHCNESGATSTRHSNEHPIQSIPTRSDFELYYGGEVFSPEQAQSFTCPYCKRMGFSDATLLEHVSSEHTDTGSEVVCPVCAASPGGEPNLVTEDLAGHLTLEHRTGPRDLISFLDEPSAIRHGGVRRIPHSGRILGGPRSRRANMHFTSSGSGLSTLSPQGRESVDLIAELQQQLNGGVRRGTLQYNQMQQLQMQIQMERQGSTNRQLERSTNIPLRQHGNPPITPMQSILSVMSFNGAASSRDGNFLTSSSSNGGVGSSNGASGGASAAGGPGNSSGPSSSSYIPLNPSSIQLAGSSNTIGTVVNVNTDNSGLGGAAMAMSSMQLPSHHNQSSPYLMDRRMKTIVDDSELAGSERATAQRSQFLFNLLLSSLREPNLLGPDEDEDEKSKKVESSEESASVPAITEEFEQLAVGGSDPPVVHKTDQIRGHHANKSNKMRHGYGKGNSIKNANFNNNSKINKNNNGQSSGSGGGGGGGSSSSAQQQQSPPSSLPLQNVNVASGAITQQTSSSSSTTTAAPSAATNPNQNPLNKTRSDLKTQPAQAQTATTTKLEDSR